MSAKHFLDDPIHAVVTALRSLTLTNPALVFDEANKIIYRHPATIENSGDKVSLICGGGSGHEPAFVAYVGKGFLTACVAGTIFASPGAEQVRACVTHRLPKDSKGILVIVMNYTGDVLNFGMGAERARAMGKNVEMIVIGDDVGVGREKSGKVGRRGIAGAVMAVKVCGALAEMGGSLRDTAHVGQLAGDNLVSVAVSLSRVHVIGRPTKDADDETRRLPFGSVELGMGIHNEPGCEQLQTDLPNTVKRMLAQLLDQNDKDRAYVNIDRTDQVIMLINNFGGLSNLELGSITMEVWTQLGEDWGLRPIRVYTGVFNGSLNGLGFGISLLKLVGTGLGEGKSMLELIDFPTSVIGWPAPIDVSTWGMDLPPVGGEVIQEEFTRPSNIKVDSARYTTLLKRALDRVVAAEPLLTKYDSIVGDGDCGAGLKRGAEAILSLLSSSPPTNDLLINFAALVHVVENTMDGTSGALYAIFLNSLVHSLRQHDSSNSAVDATPELWAKALKECVMGLQKYTPAKPGDRTLMDALVPFVNTLEASGDVKKAAAEANKGTESTKGMKASLGRSVYVGGEEWKNIPDPGAYGLSEFLLGLAEGM